MLKPGPMPGYKRAPGFSYRTRPGCRLPAWRGSARRGRMIPLLAASAFAGALLVSGLPVWAQAQTVTDLQPLTLRRPVNHVFHFTPDGHTATINREQATQDDHKVDL